MLMTDAQLDRIKRRLGIVDALQDDLINDLIDDAHAQFMAITDADMVLPKYNFIISEVVILRYNRKGSEGMKSESVDGYSVTYETDDFNAYMWLLKKDFGLDESKHRKRGVVKFI